MTAPPRYAPEIPLPPYAENTARTYLYKLVELQILEKREIRGRHYYIKPALVEILSY